MNGRPSRQIRRGAVAGSHGRNAALDAQQRREYYRMRPTCRIQSEFFVMAGMIVRCLAAALFVILCVDANRAAQPRKAVSAAQRQEGALLFKRRNNRICRAGENQSPHVAADLDVHPINLVTPYVTERSMANH